MEEKLDTIIELLGELAEIYRTPTKSSGSPWTQEEKDRVYDLFISGVSTGRITSTINKEFHSSRSVYAVNCYVKQLIEEKARERFLKDIGPVFEDFKEEKPRRKKSTFKTGIDEDDKPIMDRIYDDPPF